ncbi:thyrotropin subunit beta isoform X1 [Cygnus olor]|uniref:thyrotropin subunit beta isoform X1 n=1 Tax=Cygnus olor TaxID=8869 RepID=UPI001ADE5674|nr:thyrotropin subunit beta isoform X1 [Cygnus olor]XP_040391658.1 thyrotropin subunit beta isoform X1 [Cygnus olor]
MNPFFVMSLLFGLTFGQTASLCAPSEYTIHVEKRECAYCLAINTTICAGFCMTRDSNGKKLLLKSALSQNVCTYKEMLYQTALIPGCPHHTIPYYSYPVAISCKCGQPSPSEFQSDLSAIIFAEHAQVRSADPGIWK